MRGNLKGIGLGAAGGLLSGVAVLSIYFVASANAKGADGGDWLAFAGVAFGVAATISGTLAIDRIKEKIRHRRAIAKIMAALRLWSETVATIPNELTKAKISDLRQQHAYISAIATDISSDANTATMAAHIFCFHVPAMINRLETTMNDLHGADQAIVIEHITNEMASYAATVRGVLASKS